MPVRKKPNEQRLIAPTATLRALRNQLNFEVGWSSFRVGRLESGCEAREESGDMPTAFCFPERA